MVKVSTPVKGFTGTVAGVEFTDGKGETDSPSSLSYFARHGYEIEREKPTKSTAPKPSRK